MNQVQNYNSETQSNEMQWRRICLYGGIASIIALGGILLDVITGNITGGDLSALPQTAAERFSQFNDNKLVALYNLDFLNIMNQMIMIPVFFALYAVHRSINNPVSVAALIVFLFGSCIMVSNNTALPMLELSNKYFTTNAETQRALYAAAGEAFLAQGAHGSPGIFLGFFIPNIANLIISFVMLKGGIFSRLNSWLGITGSILMMVYIVLINFGTGVEKMATALAMPGGLLLMTWMVMYTIKLFQLSKIPVK